jgi:hypothetical protein
MSSILEGAIKLALETDRPTGELTKEQANDLRVNTDWGPRIFVYREFKPLRDTIEYTVYFRAPSPHSSTEDGTRRYRADLTVDARDIETLDSEEADEKVAFALKCAMREAQRWTEWDLRNGGDGMREVL